MAVHIKSRDDINSAIRYIVKEKGGGDLEYKGHTVSFTLKGFDLFISNSQYSFKIKAVDYKESLQEIYYIVEQQLCPKENYTKLYKSTNEFGAELSYYYDNKHDKIVMIKKTPVKENNKVVDFTYKFYREPANIANYEREYNEYKYYHTDYGTVDENYELHDWDKEFIRDTDISPEDYRKYVIYEFKGKPINPNNKPDIGSYNYKFFFKCDNCGVDTWEWHTHRSGAFVDYFPPFLCKSCKEKQEQGILGQLKNKPGRFN